MNNAQRKYKKKQKELGAFNRGDRTVQNNRYYHKNKAKVSAQSKLRHAVKIGKIIKLSCCGECESTEYICGHHKDYSKPLEVMWLCWRCHNKIHKRR